MAFFSSKQLFFWIPFLTFLFPISSFAADCLTKCDLGAAYLHLDVIVNDNTIKRIDMVAPRIEYTQFFQGGWWGKATGMKGDHTAQLQTWGGSLGRCLPIGGGLLISPSIGVNRTRLKTDLKFFIESPLYSLPIAIQRKEIFDSYTPFFGLELCYSVCSGLRGSVSFQYGWSYSKTDIKNVFRKRAESHGPSVSCLLEYDISNSCSINIGGAYNESLSRQKNGLRGYGGKLGIAFWY